MTDQASAGQRDQEGLFGIWVARVWRIGLCRSYSIPRCSSGSAFARSGLGLDDAAWSWSSRPRRQ